LSRSARGLEVLGLLAAGRPNRAIAEELVVTLETVKQHTSHILDKLGAANRTQAVARELGTAVDRQRTSWYHVGGPPPVPGAENFPSRFHLRVIRRPRRVRSLLAGATANHEGPDGPA